MTSLEDEKQWIQNDLDNARSAIERMRNQIEALKSELDEYRTYYADAQIEIEKLELKLQKVKK